MEIATYSGSFEIYNLFCTLIPLYTVIGDNFTNDIKIFPK